MMKKLNKVNSISELRHLAKNWPDYEKLAMASAKNLGGDPKSLDDAVSWLEMNAAETDEDSVVDEINNCRNFI